MEVLSAQHSLEQQGRVASALRARGLGTGDRMVMLLPGSAGYLSAVLGALRVGVVPVPLDPRLTPFERAPLLDDADPALILQDPAELAAMVSWPGRSADLADVPLARPMHYTSGTTGRPKGVSSGILDEVAAGELVREEREQWGFDSDDIHLVASPLHHSAPLRFATSTLLAGGTVLLPGPFDARTWVQAAAERHATSAFVVPAQLGRLLGTGLGSGPPSASPVSSFRLLAHAGAPCPPRVKSATVEAFPSGSVWEFYGSTEGQVTTASEADWRARPGSVGRARPGRAVRAAADGTLWVQVPLHARFEYWRDAERTARAWDPTRTAFTVGDLGRVDEDGYVFLDGRREDLIISGGVNVYPAEVEAALSTCPGVLDVAVFGRDDERWGQRVCAAVIGAAGERALRTWAAERLAPPKRPKEYHRMTAFPRTESGKVRRLDLPGMVQAPGKADG